MKIKAIITGATGMVGEGVLHECLLHPDVESVLVIGRKSCGYTHPKLKEIVHPDFFDLSPLRTELAGYNACFFCLGVSSVGMNEADYTRMTHTLTMHFAETLHSVSPDLTFCYVSGAGTDSTEKGRSMWARVKGKTENDLAKLGFRKTFAFRPGVMKPTKGLKNTLSYYKYFGWIYPLTRLFGWGTTLKETGLSMIAAAKSGYEKSVIEVKDIIALAKRA